MRRAAAGGRLAEAARGHLRQLGFTDPHLEVEVAPAQPGPDRAEVIRLLFASDRRLVPSEVRAVASGGELSRLILALRLAGGAASPGGRLRRGGRRRRWRRRWPWAPSSPSWQPTVKCCASPISPRWRRSPTPMPSSAAKGHRPLSSWSMGGASRGAEPDALRASRERPGQGARRGAAGDRGRRFGRVTYDRMAT